MFKICFVLKISNLSDSKRQQTTTVDNKRLINGFVLASVVSLQGEIQKSKTMEIPEYIEGIPTEKHASAKRREIIKNEYIRLIEGLQKKNRKKAVYNEFLQTNVYIIMRESEKKASNSAAFNWQSTYAVKHLETVIKKAIPMEGRPIYSLPKLSGNKKSSNM